MLLYNSVVHQCRLESMLYTLVSSMKPGLLINPNELFMGHPDAVTPSTSPVIQQFSCISSVLLPAAAALPERGVQVKLNCC